MLVLWLSYDRIYCYTYTLSDQFPVKNKRFINKSICKQPSNAANLIVCPDPAFANVQLNLVNYIS